VADLDDSHHVQHVVQPAVACSGQSVTGLLAAGGIDRCRSGPAGEVRLGGEPGHVPDVAEDPGGTDRADTEQP
jgi:hypothetical protein